MEKTFDVIVNNPKTGEELFRGAYSVNIMEDSNLEESSAKILNNKDIIIESENKNFTNKLIINVSEDLVEDIFYSAYPEYNKSDMTLLNMDIDFENRFDCCVNVVKAKIRFDVLNGLGIFS